MTAQMLVHASCVAINGIAILIRGESASGKSDLLLQLLETSGTGLGDLQLKAALIADDQTLLSMQGDRLWASCPETIKGLVEVRGEGIVAVTAQGPAPLGLIVDLIPIQQIERLPEAGQLQAALLGFHLPRLLVGSGTVSAASRVRLGFVRHVVNMQQC